ncbi:MAG: DUF952 domain-containing protein [Roseiflexaceae bacterium]|jgi:uncharacterized protein (DUF952 family)|nr:DUF952 domain-containing protein [Chloroflexaceae bacterium]MCE2852638.1 DUF952 domain-containing protein [Chloroflexaceae bacterium]
MPLIYHMALAMRWQTWPVGQDYLPSDYAKDGFVHCTAGDELMIKVANRFYQTVPGEFIVLVVDTDRLTSPLKWEAPSPGDTLAPLFPHIYGPINYASVVATKPLHRDDRGIFVGIGS